MIAGTDLLRLIVDCEGRVTMIEGGRCTPGRIGGGKSMWPRLPG